MAGAAKDFAQVGMVLARVQSDVILLVWYDPDRAAHVAQVEALVSARCIPVGLLGIRETPEGWRTFARSFSEHAFRPGIESYLRGLMEKFAQAYNGPIVSPVVH